MHDASRQLEQIRSRARLWLTALHGLRFVASLIQVLLVLALVDWLLNLPGWMRLVIGVLVVVECVYWLSTRLYRAIRFRPGLDELALRAERIYPQLSGVFASSVEFQTIDGDADDPSHGPHREALVNMTVNQSKALLEGVRLTRLIDLSMVSRRLVVALLAIVLLAAAFTFAPGVSRTAAARWLTPMGPAQWPRSVVLEDATPIGVCPVDAPVRLVSVVQRGHRPGMRVRVNYRLTDTTGRDGPWREALMTRQNTESVDGTASFERLIDLPPAVVRSVNDSSGRTAELSYRFQAGDGETLTQRVTLVARPAVTAVSATIEPPVYAAGLVSPRTVALHEQSGQLATTSALSGSRVSLTLVINKPIQLLDRNKRDLLIPGLVDVDGSIQTQVTYPNIALGNQIFTNFRLMRTVTTPIHLADIHGLTNLSHRRYQIEAVEDRPPSASITEPVADEAVLASAIIDLAAAAQDDIGLERLELLGATTRRGSGGETIDTVMPTLAEQSGRREALGVKTEIDLSTLDLRAGDTLVLHAVARDVYELDGQRHEPVRSSPRTLRIIDEPTLIAQIRTELAGLRQQVVRLEQTQQRIRSERPPSVTLPQQEQITQRLDAQSSLLDRLDDRMQRNRLDDPPMQTLTRQADGLIRRARGQSSAAASKLLQADEKPDEAEALEAAAHEDQEAVRRSLTDLADLLDQGRDVLTLKLQLQQLKTQQAALATDTRGLLPQTIGQSLDQLDDAQRERLEDLRQRQDELAEQARALTRQMQLTADTLARQGERDQDLAAAEALAEAAAIGQRQGLEDSMTQSSGAMQNNQLSQSGQQQDAAMDTLDRMLREMGTQERRRQAILRRRVQELSALIRQLIERQDTHADRLEQTAPDQIAVLEPGQVSIRRSTMGAQQQAGGSQETAQAGLHLADAVREQGSAVGALRAGNSPPALTAERLALEHLRSALEELDKIAEDNAAQEARKQRQKLRDAYDKYAKRQDELRTTVRALIEAGPLDRKRRAALVGLAGDQSELQQAIAKTGQDVEQTLVFAHIHEQVGVTSSRVVSALRRGEGGVSVRSDQRSIASTLRAMAEALKEEPNDSPFADAGGGGGGGGGGGSSPPAVPSLAELKLIRGLQDVIYKRTREAEASWDTQPNGPMKQQMLELSTRQRELSSLGKRLIAKMKQEQAQTRPGGEDQP